MFFFFFFQAEDGIRDHCVTGVQTCALPICERADAPSRAACSARAHELRACAGRMSPAGPLKIGDSLSPRPWRTATKFRSIGRGLRLTHEGSRRADAGKHNRVSLRLNM